ncbi:hypothetical protein GCM10009749_05440 [Agromyces neolithicus]|uniref:Sigma-70 family RNA polymerase sigma factor n=1 Tax=Agromyces neolithicus TaxID=269420 RepID=A0ABN2LW17_9MICO
MTEAELWSRALRGGGAALGAVFDQHNDRVFRHAYAVLRDVHDAEDATATAFLELSRRRTAVRVVTAANCARNVARSRRRYQTLLDSLPRGEHGESAETEAVAGLPVLDTIDGELGTQLRALARADYVLATNGRDPPHG